MQPREWLKGLYLLIPLLVLAPAWGQNWQFEDVTEASGLTVTPDVDPFWTGVSSVDFNNDGWVDLFINREGPGSVQQAFQNNGDGTFSEVTEAIGLDGLGMNVISTLFIDLDGDSWLDLVALNRLNPELSLLYRNKGDGTFEPISEGSGFNPNRQGMSLAAGDYDLDGDLDLYGAVNQPLAGASQLWRNNGDNTFTDVGVEAGILALEAGDEEFSPAFCDLNNDGWPDLTVVADRMKSQVYINNGDGTFLNVSNEVLTDEGGMGSALGDYDNDGDLDWFVSSIWDKAQNPFKPWGVSSGNRLYRNKGDGTFEDATDEAGVRIGHWGWGSVFADFDNNGRLDLFHTNGVQDIQGPSFLTDPSVFFVANGDNTFTERGEELGLDDRGLGHGVAIFDYDRDGDLDLFIANSTGSSKLYRNNGGNEQGSVSVRTISSSKNSLGVGARLSLSSGDTVQIREIRAGSNFLSQNTYMGHFGIGSHEKADLEVTWPGGLRTKLNGILSGEQVVVAELPYSWNDANVPFYRYYYAVKQALSSYIAAGRLTDKEALRLRTSALEAFVAQRYPNASR